MANQMTGRVYQISPTQEIPTKSGSTFTKREIVLDCSRFDQYTGQRYDNYPSFEFSGDKCAQLEQYKPGDLVTITFDIQGNCVQQPKGTRFFNSVRGYKIELKQSGNATTQVAPATPAPPVSPVGEQKKDDLPF